MKLGNPKNTIEVIQKYDFDFQKKFGQNFLIDERVLEKIISAAEVNKEDFVLEIGPGIGTMTQYLAENAREVMAVEIDKNLIPILSDTLSAYDNVSILNADILKVDIAKIVEEKNGGKPVKVVANLPYYITTPIIMGLFESHVPIDSITVMVQKEVADRMHAGRTCLVDDAKNVFLDSFLACQCLASIFRKGSQLIRFVGHIPTQQWEQLIFGNGTFLVDAAASHRL